MKFYNMCVLSAEAPSTSTNVFQAIKMKRSVISETKRAQKKQKNVKLKQLQMKLDITY